MSSMDTMPSQWPWPGRLIMSTLRLVGWTWWCMSGRLATQTRGSKSQVSHTSESVTCGWGRQRSDLMSVFNNGQDVSFTTAAVQISICCSDRTVNRQFIAVENALISLWAGDGRDWKHVFLSSLYIQSRVQGQRWPQEKHGFGVTEKCLDLTTLSISPLCSFYSLHLVNQK